MTGDISSAVAKIKKSLWCDEKSEWGLAAATILYESANSNLGVMNGSIGVESVVFQDGSALRRYITEQKLQDIPLQSLFTGARLGYSGITFNDIEENPEKLTKILSTEWKCIGMFNGLASLLATERVAADLEIVPEDQSAEATRIIEQCIMENVGPLNNIEDNNLYSFTDGITGIVAFGNSRFTSSMFTEWSTQCIDKLLAGLKYIDEGAFVSDGTRLLPYVSNGTAGVLLAMLSLPTDLWRPSWGSSVEALLRAIAPRFTLNAGFGEGASGLIFTAARCAKILDCDVTNTMIHELVDDILRTRIYEVEGPRKKKMYHVMSEGQMAVSRDLWTGTAGTYVALEEYLGISQETTEDHDLLRTLLKY